MCCFIEESDAFCNARRYSSRIKRNIDGTYRWPRPLDGSILIQTPPSDPRIHSTVALQLPAAEKLLGSLPLSRSDALAICMKLETSQRAGPSISR